jgi:hypothetical protein
MRPIWRRLLIFLAVYCALWLVTAIFGTRQVCGQLRETWHIDATYSAISCSEIPDYHAVEHGYGCCAVSYAPFLVVTQHAFCNQGFSTGGSAVFLWLGYSWPMLPWPWGHSWIT